MAPIVLIEVSQSHADPPRLDQLSRYLQRDLQRLGLPVARQAAQVPIGAKAGGASLATLLVGFAGSAAVGSLVNGIFAWLGTRRTAIKISCGDKSVELSAATPEERERLLALLTAWSER